MSRSLEASELIAGFYEAALTPTHWPEVLHRLGRLFGGSTVMFGVQDRRAGPTYMAHARFDPAYLAVFHALNVDPRHNKPLRALLSAPVGVPQLAVDVSWRDEFVRSEAFDLLMRPQGLQDGAQMTLVQDPDHFVALSLMQPLGSEPFDEADRALMLHLLPHLQRAAQVMLRLGSLTTQVQALEEALDRLPLGIVLVDAAGRPIELNRIAARIAAEADGLRIGRDGLVAASAQATRALQHLIATAAATGAGQGSAAGGAMALARPSGRRPLALLVAPLVREPGPSARWPAAILFVTDPEQADQPPEAVLRRLYGLTPAEARLAARLLAGQELNAIAAETGVSTSTVRSHLKAIFAKTGVTRQSELVRLLLRGPAGLAF